MGFLEKPWRALSPEEARDYLDRFLSEQPERIEQLIRLSGSTGGPRQQELDFEPGSLVPLWSWARRRLAWHEGYTPNRVPTLPPLEQPPDEAPTPLRELPSWAGAIPGIHRTFSADTLWLIDMVARYFAEVLLRANPQAGWQVGHSRIKGYAEENQPVLSWGSDVLNPIALVRVVASRELADDDESPRDERLRDTFDIWMEMVSDRGEEGSGRGG